MKYLEKQLSQGIIKVPQEKKQLPFPKELDPSSGESSLFPRKVALFSKENFTHENYFLEKKSCSLRKLIPCSLKQMITFRK
jgi:hypothetical protein